MLGGGFGEGFLERADEVGVGGFERVLLGVGGGLSCGQLWVLGVREASGAAYLRGMLDLERRLAR